MAESFDARYPELSRLAFRVAYQVLGSAADAEDVAAETLTRALLRWRSVHGHAPAWVTTVTVRLALDVGRRRRRQQPLGDADTAQPDQHVDQRLDLVAALRWLPRRQREALACRYLADLSDDDTAALLGIGVGSVKQHAARGLAALRPHAGATEEANSHA